MKDKKHSEKELVEKQKKIDELTDTTKRVQAEFENYKKRSEKDQQQYIDMGKIVVLRKILPVLDSFEQVKDDPKIAPLYNQLNSALTNIGVEPIDIENEEFNPHIHECVCEEKSDKAKGMITEEIQKGYKVSEYIIRHSIVKVSGGKKKEEKKEDDNIKTNT